MAGEEQKVWQDRLKGLNEQIEIQRDVAQKLIDDAASTPYQKKSITALTQLLDTLEIFAGKQFEYLYNGFFEANIEPHLTPLKKFPPQNVMQATLDQVGFDLWVISNAISQRADPANNDILQKADFLSQKALEPALGYELENKRVICYLLKSPSVRVIPYANTALIGIPQTVGKVFRDYLAIPHEVGHLVYWLGMVEGESIYSILQSAARNKDSYVNRWIEEIFADIYGTSVAGPAVALSFQNLHLQVPQDEFFEDDWDHPPAILRPNIYNKVLEKRNFSGFAQALHKRWNGNEIGKDYQGGKIHDRFEKDPEIKRTQDAIQEEVLEQYDHSFRQANGQYPKVKDEMTVEPGHDWDDKKKIDRVVKSIYQKIHGSPGNQNRMDFSKSWWLEGFDQNGNDSTTLFSTFRNKIEELEAEDISPEIAINEAKTIKSVDYEELKERWMKEGKRINPDLKKEHEWVYVFMANGWTTEGPHSNPPPP